MEKTLNDINSYIKFLATKNIYVVISGMDSVYLPCMKTLLEYEVHPFALCHFLKSNEKTKGKCALNKSILIKRDFDKICYGCCYAGVEEYVIPVFYKDKKIINVHVTGFKNSLKKSILRTKIYSEKSGENCKKLYDDLSSVIPDKREIFSYVNPLIYMLKELYNICEQRKKPISKEEEVYNRAMSFIYANYSFDISCKDIAKHLNFSSSYIRRIFEICDSLPVGKRIREIRLSKALDMLKTTNYNITQIAGFCGFNDSNYFSTVFKNKFKISPKNYRNKC